MSVLDQLAELLRSRPHTAKEIAKALKCCKPTAYKRIKALVRRGDRIYTVIEMRDGISGPPPALYGIR